MSIMVYLEESWARNEEAIFAIKREMERTPTLKVTIPNKLNNSVLDRIFKAHIQKQL